MISFTLYGQTKSGKNGMLTTRTGRHYPNKVWAEWRDRMVNQLWNVRRQETFDKPCELEVKYWKGDERRRDVSGMLDALFHCFEKAGIVADDKLFVNVDWELMGLDRENPRVDVTITSLE